MEDIVGSIDAEDFKYFVANSFIVAGVTKEDDDKVYFVVLKAKGWPRGKQGELDKNMLQSEIENGQSVLMYDFDAAEEFDMEEFSNG